MDKLKFPQYYRVNRAVMLSNPLLLPKKKLIFEQKNRASEITLYMIHTFTVAD